MFLEYLEYGIVLAYSMVNNEFNGLIVILYFRGEKREN